MDLWIAWCVSMFLRCTKVPYDQAWPMRAAKNASCETTNLNTHMALSMSIQSCKCRTGALSECVSSPATL